MAEEELYEVEDLLEYKEIVDDGGALKHKFFLVKWRGFDDPTWEPDGNLGT